MEEDKLVLNVQMYLELPSGKVRTHITAELNASQFGLCIADLVRHFANGAKIHENEVWQWVDAERENPTSPIVEIRPS